MQQRHFAIHALADRLTPAPNASTDLAHATGQVEAVNSGVVTVRVLGAAVQAPYYGSLPAQGDTVGVLFIEGSPVILGVPKGVPPTIPTS